MNIHRICTIALKLFLPFLITTIWGCGGENQHVSFDLDGDSQVAGMIVKAPKDERYSVKIEYFYKSGDLSDRSILWNGLGGQRLVGPSKFGEIGASFDVHVKILEAESGRVIYENTIVAPKLSSWGDGFLCSEVADVYLKAGSYQLLVQRDGAAGPIGSYRAQIIFAKAFYGK